VNPCSKALLVAPVLFFAVNLGGKKYFAFLQHLKTLLLNTTRCNGTMHIYIVEIFHYRAALKRQIEPKIDKNEEIGKIGLIF
jgi:hypothetical protein